ncbi:MAG: hypothetical protein A3B74_04750 [Candidatus Kerfeldbacteria bacterium RIFCSPHIGHO2_02_FULL_42_14]|uniref:Uncharacterized protein n=1 Tax=Candidatus Kerfeldbacteria bacterium RIFCSPHIGHO2_02_FULL_42_14 TaxID=1798540 RepID=A0A1G2AP04_9BACT|nr:MAG: hypothetical protein A3B74_04750 [Candidatus Kerfeldbacteria bacterium RIFCSPHIGHO2_02_FULL_42_14]OGY81031.1 MAG: hypothetical protein A3E60_03470 [Candidatus Kerfeldbacteria bacterium RIFCSPHIGHO2_12_FULL_42_13]OGY84848.1 MAG: hypothetical protein A3I91_05115 [Candidatus Kerfeldbacteria bacterium RIFCSPLOWO2_02_FULL_42_19]OGY85652.1 MAG: hypothetical protein A3G01_04755 [Candidatus Kerfeldbacteria bacterium RIFCSPLOWO2_12_FULL_43_9]
MLLDWILLSIAIVALAVCVIIVIRKFPHLRILDIESARKHIQQRIKFSIIEERLKRKLKDTTMHMAHRVAPTHSKIQSIFHRLQEKVKKLELRYTQVVKQVTPERREKNRQKIEKLLETGKEFIEKNNLIEAERSFIEAISLDHQNQEAYKKLAEVYVLQKNWEHAKESLEFLLKLDPKNAQLQLELSQVCKHMDQMREAFEHAKTAVMIAPNDPKYLNELLELCFMFGQKYTAKKTFEKLKEVNPENQRIPEWEEKLKKM